MNSGKGYVAGRPQNRPEDAPIGLVPVDSIFYSPVRKVSYHVDNTRVGQVTWTMTRLSMDRRRPTAR